MTNFTNSTLLNQQFGYPLYVIGPFALVTLLVNISFFILGLLKLKKTAHNMFVISMCGGDSLYGVSLFILVLLNHVDHGFPELCLSQIIIYFLAVNMSLTVALLICIERYITIRQNNFGQLAHSLRWKRNLAAGLLTTTTLYVIVCILAVPRISNETTICYLNFYYDAHYYQFIMGLLSGLFASLALGIVVIYGMIICMMFKCMIAERKIKPECNTHSQESSSGCQLDRFKNRGNEMNDHVNKTGDTVNHDVVEILPRCNNGERHVSNITFSTNDNVTYVADTASVPEVHVHFDIPTTSTHTNALKDKDGNGSGINSQIVNGRSQAIEQIVSDPLNKLTLKEKETLSAWKKFELRALATSGYIIGSTLLLHGPLIFCLIFNVIGISYSRTLGNTAALLLSLQCVINPFIYAFRFPELRQAIKNLMCCRKGDQVSGVANN